MSTGSSEKGWNSLVLAVAMLLAGGVIQALWSPLPCSSNCQCHANHDHEAEEDPRPLPSPIP